METLRLTVRKRTILLDVREFVFLTDDGLEVEHTDTDGVVKRITRHVNRRTRGKARAHARAQALHSLRQFNSPKEGYTQFVVVEPHVVNRVNGLEGIKRDYALDEAVVTAIHARLPVDLKAIERWARDRDSWIGLSGKNQLLGGKARITRTGLRTDFEPEKLVARSLLEKPEAFTGPTLRVLVVDDPFVDEVTGDGAFLVKASAPRACSRLVTQRVRRTLEYEVKDADIGEPYLVLEHVEKRARHRTEILSATEEGDLLVIEKEEHARIDTGAKLVHEKGFKGTAIVVDEFPEHVTRHWPRIDAITNASCIKGSALISGHAQEVLWGDFQRAWLLHLPVRLLFTGRERMKGHGNRISLNVLSTLHTVAPNVAERFMEARVDEGPGAVLHGLLWWAERLKSGPDPAESGLPVDTKADLREVWKEEFERRLAFGDPADHPLLDPEANPRGFVVKGRGGNQVLVPSARLLLATLGRVEVEGEPGFWFPDYVNTLLQVIRMLDVKPDRFKEALGHLRSNVLKAAHAMRKGHSIRVPGIHGVLVAVKGLGKVVVVPDGYGGFSGTIHGEPTMNRDGIREADVLPLGRARDRSSSHPSARWLLEHLTPGAFEVVLADFERLTRMNRDNDGDLVYLSRVAIPPREMRALERRADAAPGFVDPEERFRDIQRSFRKIRSDHEPLDLPPEVVHRAVLETAGSAQDVGSITLFKYVANEALAHAGALELVAPIARIAQAYIDGLKGPHQQSANLFAALMRVWARMSMPCRSVRDEKGEIVEVRLAPNLERELVRAGYVDGLGFLSAIEVPHPAFVDEAYRKIKRPLVGILEEILVNLQDQGLATRAELKQIRDILEGAYGQYPREQHADTASVVAERREDYVAVRRLYGMQRIESLEQAERVGRRPLWARLLGLSLDATGASERLDAMAEKALAHAVIREDRIVL
jgi:hypothetical protein